MTNNYGIIATESGVPVDGAPDYRMVSNSNWPTLQVEFEYILGTPLSIATVGGSTASIKIFSHNLGYVPAYTYIDSSGYNGLGTGYSTGTGNDTFSLIADKENIYLVVTALGSSYNFTPSGLLRIYSYNPSTTFQAPFYNPADPRTNVGTYGIEALINANDGYLDDTNFSKYSVSSRAKTLTIHQSGLATADGAGQFVLTHNLGYLPSFMIFKSDGTFLADQTSVRSQGNQTTLTFFGVQSILIGDYAYIIFKDPIMQTQL